ncbi:uncharacterized protein LOC123722715 [Papilio machaon]|uniref:uncharacterized protein LOC123722715 n=1 Tax=Papilio machaon TaxID=76193 RepID=UPI001E665F65|nr:uncharacterized protein LOC123722715 [Papilio machaon]
MHAAWHYLFQDLFYLFTGKLVVKKWKSMRDEWMKCHRKLSESKSGSGANPIVHKYTNYDNMKFYSIYRFYAKKEKKTDDSRIMSFFKSIAPTIEKFSDDEVVEFQYQVISILRNFKQRNINSNTSESQSIHLQESIQLQLNL